MARSPFGELPESDRADDGSGYWPGERTTWGGRGRMPVFVVLGVLAAVLVVVLALTFLSDSDAGSGSASVGSPPPPVLASEGVTPGTPVQLGGYSYTLGVGPFAASTRGSTAGSHLLLAPLVVRNTSGAPAPNPLASLRVQIGLASLPASVTTGPSAVLCQNRPAVSPLSSGPATYPGLPDGACVLEARTSASGSAAMLAPDEEARGTLLSTPVPDAVTDTTASVWTETRPGAWQRVG
ncbi:hypothetical protein GCM10023201_53240 [Actinomycetospora corticicola]|uniref:DUF4352 domain-containing protein n=1 Tax=Actinomycetospora corticicola TaxID=663602 RepID=A0A7Y9DRZ7_9PSEU|nr:hypothetical protein [Actinomycetospora corticicola]NYD34400.1 hypothetical protein [Actinomycetospora corticicola]